MFELQLKVCEFSARCNHHGSGRLMFAPDNGTGSSSSQCIPAGGTGSRVCNSSGQCFSVQNPVSAPCFSTLRELCQVSPSWREAALSVFWSHLDLSSGWWLGPNRLTNPLHDQHRRVKSTFNVGEWIRFQRRSETSIESYFSTVLAMGWPCVESCRLDLFDGEHCQSLYPNCPKVLAPPQGDLRS